MHALWTGLVAGAGYQQMAFWIHERSGAMFRPHMFRPVAIHFVETGFHSHHHGSTTTTFVLTPTRAHVSMRCPLIQPERQNRGELLSFIPSPHFLFSHCVVELFGQATKLSERRTNIPAHREVESDAHSEHYLKKVSPCIIKGWHGGMALCSSASQAWPSHNKTALSVYVWLRFPSQSKANRLSPFPGHFWCGGSVRNVLNVVPPKMNVPNHANLLTCWEGHHPILINVFIPRRCLDVSAHIETFKWFNSLPWVQ